MIILNTKKVSFVKSKKRFCFFLWPKNVLKFDFGMGKIKVNFCYFGLKNLDFWFEGAPSLCLAAAVLQQARPYRQKSLEF